MINYNLDGLFDAVKTFATRKKSANKFPPTKMLIFLVLIGFMTKLSANSFTTEEQLATRYTSEIATFWQQGEFSSFSGVNDIRINYALFNHNDLDKKCLVISSGRSEGYLKYKELSYDLFKLGFNVFLIDHRGQGLSERLLENSHKGYVDKFQYYVDDLSTFIDSVVKPNCALKGNTNKPYLLAHSMGGAIAARYLQEHPKTIQAAVLSSPMLGFNSVGIPNVIATSLIKVANQVNQWVGGDSWYFIGQADYVPNVDAATAFTDNPLMQSPLRFQHFYQTYHDTPALQLGGVTVKWLAESLTALDTIFTKLDKITTPTLVLQAGDDSIVSNEAQNDFCQQLHQLHSKSCPNGKPVVVEEAYHELFFEKDSYRQQALTATIKWFEEH